MHKALREIAPWDGPLYPGRAAIALALTPRNVGPLRVEFWKRNPEKLPAGVARAWAGELRARAARGLGIAAELEKLAEEKEARPRHLPGAQRLLAWRERKARGGE